MRTVTRAAPRGELGTHILKKAQNEEVNKKAKGQGGACSGDIHYRTYKKEHNFKETITTDAGTTTGSRGLTTRNKKRR